MQVTKYMVFIFLSFLVANGFCQQMKDTGSQIQGNELVLPGAWQTDEYVPLLKGKRVAVVANNTSLLGKSQLVDTLISSGIHVVKIFGPEHGFRGDQPDGKEIGNIKDPKTGVEIISLYGDHRKPTLSDMQNVDIVLFDIQDAGARFYTYISTLTYIMEACAENNIPLVITDRPNPNGFYVDGPVLEPEYSSFIGMHPVPVVYGLTIGEYALMVNGEKWLKGEKSCNLSVIKCKNYTHKSRYQLPVRPSPNLQDMQAVYLYPSLCLFEGTVVSVGRGTVNPFKIYGHPKYTLGSYAFVPEPIKGVSEDPPLKGEECHGQYLGDEAEKIQNNGQLRLDWLIEAYKNLNGNTKFFNNYFDKLAGTKTLREQVISGMDELEIRKSWEPGLRKFLEIRKRYLLYPDFE